MRLLTYKNRLSFRNLSILKQNTFTFLLLLTFAVLATSIVIFLVAKSNIEHEIVQTKIETLKNTSNALTKKIDDSITLSLDLWNNENIYTKHI